jgi:hypothetical protein
MFIRSAHGGGGSSVHCNCGRDHYAPSNLQDSDEPEDYQSMVDSCEAEQEANPDGVVIDYESDFIHYSEIDGNTFVDGCPCNGLRRYEDFIWNNRNVIREYYRIRIDQELKWAEQEAVLNKLSGI